MSTDTTLLRVENLRQYFKAGTIKAVDNISFEIKKGEVFSLVGESGSGKTTTGRSIIALNRITGGQIYFNGSLVNAGTYGEKNASEIRRLNAQVKKSRKEKIPYKMQMIFQDPATSLDPRMTVGEIIAEGLKIQGIKNEREIYKKVSEVLLKTGLLPEYMEHYPHEFSGGQRQIIGIARALVMNPELIIADEPVSALDVSIKAQIINLLNELKHTLGLTILFIAHDLSVVKYFSDRIAVMYKGKIVELADSDELFRHPLHPYTKSLLSAIPLPDPEYEKTHTRIIYNPLTAHDYSKEQPEFREITAGHFVMCSSAEESVYKSEVQGL